MQDARGGMQEGLTRVQILEAFAAVANALNPSTPSHELTVMGGAALVLLYGARESTKDVDAIISDPARLTPHVIPGRELKARYAFDDLWEAEHGRP